MNTELKTGPLSLILAALTAVKGIALAERDRVTVSTDMSEIDTLRAKMETARAKLIDPRSRDNVLVGFQVESTARGYASLTLGTNIYGWSVCDFMGANIRGGRAAITRRGATLAHCIALGCDRASQKNVEFAFYLKHLPADVIGPVHELVTSRVQSAVTTA
jgi:hypothetical protein